MIATPATEPTTDPTIVPVEGPPSSLLFALFIAADAAAADAADLIKEFVARTSEETVEMSKVGVTVYLITVTDVEVAVIPFLVTKTIDVDVVVRTTGG